MNKRILKNWSLVRIIWLAIGITIGVGAVIEHNYFLLLPALYFTFGAIANVGCFAQSCAVNFSKHQKEETADSEFQNIHYKNEKP